MATAALIQRTVTVQFRNDLKDGKKGRYGSIKADGQSYLAQEDIWETIEQGRTYTIKYQKPDGDFPPWIKSVESEEGEPLTPPVRNTQAPVSTQKAYSKQANGGSNLDACICGLLKSFIEAGKVPLDAAAISKARTICQAGWLNEMNDEIPY